MDTAVIKLSRVVSTVVGLMGLGFVVLCVPLVILAAQRIVVLAVPFGLVLAWLAYVCGRLVLDRTELRLDAGGLAVNGRRRNVRWTWEDVAAVGFTAHKGHEFLAFRPADASPPRLKFFLYPTWSDELGVVVLGRLDSIVMPRSEIQGAVQEFAPDKWMGQIPVRSATT